MSRLHELARVGQSVWFDYIQRSLISSGELSRLIREGVRGITSNPAIFEKAITQSGDYDVEIAVLAREGKDVLEIYESLVMKDIALACDVFMELYAESRGVDGYVSVEVSPHIAYDADSTVREASRIFELLAKPNVMIKVPATKEGLTAIEELTARGVNVNATLIFSVKRYEEVARAHLRGLQRRLDGGLPLDSTASVASFFVSRIDTAVDAELDRMGMKGLQGKAAIASARLAYARFKELFSGGPWDRLASRGARVQRPLWASTGTKNPGYPDTMYVDNLVGAHTVNTLPPATLGAYIDHGRTAATLETGLSDAEKTMEELEAAGIDLASITARLEEEGVKAFQRSFDTLLEGIGRKRDEVTGG
ncbi:MAG TPA: transaldolase [Deltaproteobacteria bacterium]|nr:transaldolase [Deltaproteobacteria bacterium]